MIEKVKVRGRVAEYEIELRQKIDELEKNLSAMRNACPNTELEQLVCDSKKYIQLYTKRETLISVLRDIRDLRFDPLFDEEWC